MEIHLPHQEDTDFILEQLRAPDSMKYPLPPEIVAMLDRVKTFVP